MKMSNSAKASAVTTVLYKKGLTPKYAMVLAAALIAKQPEMEFGLERWYEEMILEIYNTEMTIAGTVTTGWAIEGFLTYLTNADLVTEAGEPGPYLLQLDEDKPVARPMPASATRIARNRSMVPGFKPSKLTNKALGALQKTGYMVDEYIFDVADKVFAEIDCDERYVLEGCRVLIAEGNVEVNSEFFADRRIRMYQGDCHGPNGQASDMARGLMDLSGVSQAYDDDKAIKVIMDELADMISCSLEEAVAAWKEAGSAHQFVINCLTDKFEGVNKPWSFIKAVRIKKLIEAGKKPYIGMAFGLDAKCSGPQLGALMTNDVQIAKACGFDKEEGVDAYKLASDKCLAAGFAEIPRTVIKKPYMGIFYGQGKGAFQFAENFDEKCKKSMALLEIIKTGPGADLEENGELFHKAVEASFGNMLSLRAAIRKAHYTMDDEGSIVMLTDKATSHFMPDGSEVKMAYKHKVNIEGGVIEYGDEVVDVTIKIGLETIEFKEMKLTTKDDSLYDFARAGFVNLIQATDALLARLIVSNLEDLGATHIIAVHDCFRVNINDMIEGKLHKAIELSYMQLFGNTSNEPTELLPLGTDIMKMYFQGVNEAGGQCSEPSQFLMHPVKKEEVRAMRFIGKHTVADLISDLTNSLESTGKSYYFAK